MYMLLVYARDIMIVITIITPTEQSCLPALGAPGRIHAAALMSHSLLLLGWQTNFGSKFAFSLIYRFGKGLIIKYNSIQKSGTTKFENVDYFTKIYF
jgi:hypothetical protein